jgi:hypothetical protein
MDITALNARSSEVLATPGLIDKVIELGAAWRDEPQEGPDRKALVDLANA